MLSSMPTKSNQVFHAITKENSITVSKVTRYTLTVNMPQYYVNYLIGPPPPPPALPFQQKSFNLPTHSPI